MNDNTKKYAASIIYSMDRDIKTDASYSNIYRKKVLGILVDDANKKYENTKDKDVYIPLANTLSEIMDTTLPLEKRIDMLAQHLQ